MLWRKAGKYTGLDRHIGRCDLSKILIVDDEILVLMGVAAMTESLGYDIVTAGDGESALDIIRNDPAVMAMITDQTMPKMSGDALLAAVLNIKPGFPMVLMTGRIDGKDLIYGKIGLLQKPFTVSDLEAALNSALDFGFLPVLPLNRKP